MSFLVIIISLITFVILMGKCSFRYTTGCQGDFYLMAEGMQQNIYYLFDCGTKNIMLLLPLECAQKLLFLHSRVEKIIQIMKKKTQYHHVIYIPPWSWNEIECYITHF